MLSRLCYTSNPSTPSKSPTVLETTPHMFRKAVCRKVCIDTSLPSVFLTRSFGANMSPAQKHVLYILSIIGVTHRLNRTHAIVAAASF